MIFADTESTGITANDELLSIAIVSEMGQTLLDTYLTPSRIREWPKAQQRNNISPEFIFSGHFPTADLIRNQVRSLLQEDYLVLYNVNFDRPLIERTWYKPGEGGLENVHCCMNRFARYRGFPATKPYHTTGYKTWKLTEAAEYTGFVWPGRPHSALSDALATAHVWQWLDAKGAALA